MTKRLPREVDADSRPFEEARRAFVKNNRIDLLAGRVGMSEGVLYDRLNPDRFTHPLPGELILALTAQSGDYCLIEGLAASAGRQVYEPPSAEASPNIVKLIMQRQVVDGTFADLYDKALDDGHLDNNERAELCASLDQASTIIARLKASLNCKQGVA